MGNKDNRIMLSNDAMVATLNTHKYIDPVTFSTIFSQNWLCDDGKYSFSFKLHGSLSGRSEEIAIGFVTKEYDIGNKLGIGADDKGWSWYIYDASDSSTYLV